MGQAAGDRRYRLHRRFRQHTLLREQLHILDQGAATVCLTVLVDIKIKNIHLHISLLPYGPEGLFRETQAD
ncbi:hypothetical protein D3C75_1158750 [compost metagenome]